MNLGATNIQTTADLNLGKFSVIIASNISSVPHSLLLLVFPLRVWYTFCSGPTVLKYSVSFFFLSFTSLLFCFESFYWRILKLRDSFLSCVQSTNRPIEGILDFCYNVFWPLAFIFNSFLEFPSLCLHCPSLLVGCQFRTLSILTIVVLHFWLDNSNIPVISESGSDACFFSSYCVFSLIIFSW